MTTLLKLVLVHVHLASYGDNSASQADRRTRVVMAPSAISSLTNIQAQQTEVPSAEASLENDVIGLHPDLRGKWSKCHLSIRCRLLQASDEIKQRVPKFDLSTLVAPSDNLHATRIRMLHYAANACSKDNQRLGYVKGRISKPFKQYELKHDNGDSNLGQSPMWYAVWRTS
jgi:hypothetical protein